MADKNEYVSARTRSKTRLESNKAIMSKAHEEGGDMTSSECLASAFLLLGIGDSISDDDAKIEPIIEPTLLSARTRANHSPTKLHYKVRKQDNGRKPCARNGRYWWRITHSISLKMVLPSIHQ